MCRGFSQILLNTTVAESSDQIGKGGDFVHTFLQGIYNAASPCVMP